MRRTPPISDAEREAIVRRALFHGISQVARDLEVTSQTLHRVFRGEPVAVATVALIRGHIAEWETTTPQTAAVGT